MNTENSELNTQTDVASTAALPSPGAMIREARERLHYSVDDMVAHTKLSRATLVALERDDAQALEPVYIRGYYRKCAKVLELSEDRLIAAYQARVAPKEPEAPAKLRLASGTELGSNSRFPVSIGIFTAVAAVVACAFLWFARDHSVSYPLPTSVAELPTAAPSATPDAVVEVAPVDPSAAVPGDAAVVGATDATNPAVVAATAAPAPAVGAAPGSLHLRYVKTSWVRVDDAAGATLLNETRSEGGEDTLNGQPPLSLFLGNAPGVEVEFEGQRVDISSYVRGNNTARFTLPLAPAAQ